MKIKIVDRYIKTVKDGIFKSTIQYITSYQVLIILKDYLM